MEEENTRQDSEKVTTTAKVKMEPVDDFITNCEDILHNKITAIGTVVVLNTQIKKENCDGIERTEGDDNNLTCESVNSFVKIEQKCYINGDISNRDGNSSQETVNLVEKTKSDCFAEISNTNLHTHIKHGTSESDENIGTANIVVNSVVKIRQDVFDNFDNVTKIDHIKQEISQDDNNEHESKLSNKHDVKPVNVRQIKQEINDEYEEVDEMEQSDGKTEENRVTCEMCGKSLFNESTLRRHMKIHAPEHIYPCKWCGKKFTKRNMLKKHSRKHNGEKPYVCNECGMSFSWNGSLGRHKKIHTGEKPYKCQICDKAFARSSYLESHMAMHTGERRYTCPVCGKLFADQPGLIRHSRTHTGETPYKCEQCGKSVTSKRSLRDHIMIHTGERPYVCIEPGCEKSFRVPNGLSKHAETHLKVRNAHTCSICNNQYAYISGLKRHLKTHIETFERKKRGPNKKKKQVDDTKLNIKTEIG